MQPEIATHAEIPLFRQIRCLADMIDVLTAELRKAADSITPESVKQYESELAEAELQEAALPA